MGINRLSNIYAGLFGMLLLRDRAEDALHLPAGNYEVPLILYDRDFTADGQLFYDVSGDPASPWIPEFSADGILINGKIRPFLSVEPRLYRFRLLNAANSRFFNLSLSDAQPLVQIGTDQGLLAAPVEMPRLTLGCAERADLLIDFTHAPGQTIHLRTGAQDILQFRVAQHSSPAPSSSIPKTLRPLPRLQPSPPPPQPAPSPYTSTRTTPPAPWSCCSTASTGTNLPRSSPSSTPPKSGSSST